MVLLPSEEQFYDECISTLSSLEIHPANCQSFNQGFQAAVAYLCRFNPNEGCFCGCHAGINLETKLTHKENQ